MARLAQQGRDRRVQPDRGLDIIATGELPPADRLVLDAYAEHTADGAWALRIDTLLAAVDAGRPLAQLRQFLQDRTSDELPGTLLALLDDVTARTTRLRDLGVIRLVECDDPALTALITTDRTLRDLCTPVGERHVALPLEHELAFRKALRTLGYALPHA